MRRLVAGGLGSGEEILAGTSYAGPNGADGAFQNLCDLLIRQVKNLREYKGLTPIGR